MAKINQESEEDVKAKIKVADFIKKEDKNDEGIESMKETDDKKETVSSDNEDENDEKEKVKKEPSEKIDVSKKEGSVEKDGKSQGKQEEGEEDCVSVKKEIKTEPKADEEDEEVRRTFEEGESSRTDFLNKVKEGLSTQWPKVQSHCARLVWQ